MKNFNLVALAEKLGPSIPTIAREIEDLRKAHPYDSKDKLANRYCKNAVYLYTLEGAGSACPGAIPGFGTGAQIAIEAASITGDLYLMIRYMFKMCVATGIIYGRDMTLNANQDLVNVLGIWCGVIDVAKKTTQKVLEKIALKKFKKIPGKVFLKINNRIGYTVFAKYGTKRAPIAVGKLIPLGIGIGVAGTFNYTTLNTFKKAAFKYYRSDDDTAFVIN